jgi:hypothetical protein
VNGWSSPVELSVKLTVNGALPVKGDPVKSVLGTLSVIGE